MIEYLPFLISYEEFSKELKQRFIAGFITAEQAFNYQCNYIDIMHKTLELGMFVTCVDGVPLEKPKEYNTVLGNSRRNKLYVNQYLQYEISEQKVLFKGFEIDEITTSKIYITNGNIYLSFDKETKKQISKMDMIKLCSYNIELTEDCKQLITK